MGDAIPLRQPTAALLPRCSLSPRCCPANPNQPCPPWQALEFFAARGISAATLARNRVAQERVADGSTALAFPYFRDGSLVNIKYRSLHEKKFWQVGGWVGVGAGVWGCWDARAGSQRVRRALPD